MNGFLSIKKLIKEPRLIRPTLLQTIGGGPIGYLKCAFASRGVTRQKEKVDSLLKEDLFTLVILDACRYDVFEDEYQEFLSGNLDKVWSSGVNTFEYVRNIWPEWYDVIYISGAPCINSLNKTPRGLERLYKGYIPSEHFPKIIDISMHGWSWELRTTPPEEVTHSALKHQGNKMVVHYFQPHRPYIGEEGLPQRDIIGKVRKREIPESELWRSYRSNLRKVLTEVKQLVECLDGRIVVTSDHGECLGKDWIYGHFVGMFRGNHPDVREVPWLEIHRESGPVKREAKYRGIGERVRIKGKVKQIKNKGLV